MCGYNETFNQNDNLTQNDTFQNDITNENDTQALLKTTINDTNIQAGLR